MHRTRQPDPAALVGRPGECARLDALLASARAGEGGALVLCGESGAGKTALLARARRRALDDGMLVLAATGVESESELAHAGLHELLGPVLERRRALTPAQAAALEAALALGEPRPTDRFPVCAAVHALLVAVAEERPVLCLVDDAHWCDAASVEALAFAAARLGADGVAVLAAARDEAPAAFSRLVRMDLPGLGAEAVGELIAGLNGSEVAAEVAAAVAGATGGNPMAVVEVGRTLREAQRRGHEPLDEIPPAAETARRRFVQSLAGLAEPGRRALLLAAVVGGEDLGAIADAGAHMGVSLSDLEEAEAAGLLAIDGARLTLTHPLVRSAVYHQASAAGRREAHAAAAVALTDERRAWHLASAALGPDEQTAAALEAVARAAGDRGAPIAAARGLERAAELSPDADRRRDRLAEAARAAHLGGRSHWARELLERAVRLAGDPGQRASLDRLRGGVEARAGAAEQAAQLLERAAAVLPGPEAAAALAEAALPRLRAGQPREAEEVAVRAVERAEAGGPTELAARVMLGTARVFRGRLEDGRREIDRALDLARAQDGDGEPMIRAYLGTALRLAGDLAGARAFLDDLIADARAAGALGVLPYALLRRAGVDLDEGDWTRARSRLLEAVELASAVGNEPDAGLALGQLAWIDGACGRAEDCRRRAEEAGALAGRLGPGSRRDHAAAALALLDLGAGRAGEAAARLTPVVAAGRAAGWCDAAVPPHHAPDLVEALWRSERPEEARDELAAYAEEVERCPRASAQAALWRCRGMLAEGEEAAACFARALQHHDAWPSPFERGRTLLAEGERRRRGGRKAESRQALEMALAAFEPLGAEPWAARARAELRASGARMVTEDAPALEELTAQEFRIASEVGAGRSNREVAALLFLSTKTIEMHLSRVYRKLRIRSRTELARRLADGAPALREA